MTQAQELRIISLLPGATEMVAALGLTSSLVGRSHECDYPSEVRDLPVCTQGRLNPNNESAEIDRDVRDLVESALSIYEIKTELIQQLRPTHILTQDQCSVCAVTLAQVEEAMASMLETAPQLVSMQGKMLTGVWADLKAIAQALGVDAEPTLQTLRDRVAACTDKVNSIPLEQQPTVAALEWTNPLMAAGSWIPELIKLAGGRPVVDITGEQAPYLTMEQLLTYNPQYIIVMPCGFDLDRTRQETQILTLHPDWTTLRAVQEGKVYITDGNAYFNRPSPRLIDSLEILAEILHPDLFDYGYRGQAWEPYTASVRAA